MVLGMILGRRRFFQDSEAWLPLVKRLQWWLLGAGLACGAYFGTYFAVVDNPNVPSVARTFAGITYNLGRVLITAFYVATLVRAAHHPRWRERLAPIATAGRMPLTNYLMQTLITTPIFFGWGFGLWGKVGPALDLVLAAAIFFLVQVPFSRWWLRHFDMGPMEYLWRRLVYVAGVRSAGAAPAPPAFKP
jgi:uncharacterized protein